MTKPVNKLTAGRKLPADKKDDATAKKPKAAKAEIGHNKLTAGVKATADAMKKDRGLSKVLCEQVSIIEAANRDIKKIQDQVIKPAKATIKTNGFNLKEVTQVINLRKMEEAEQINHLSNLHITLDGLGMRKQADMFANVPEETPEATLEKTSTVGQVIDNDDEDDDKKEYVGAGPDEGEDGNHRLAAANNDN